MEYGPYVQRIKIFAPKSQYFLHWYNILFKRNEQRTIIIIFFCIIHFINRQQSSLNYLLFMIEILHETISPHIQRSNLNLGLKSLKQSIMRKCFVLTKGGFWVTQESRTRFLCSELFIQFIENVHCMEFITINTENAI